MLRGGVEVVVREIVVALKRQRTHVVRHVVDLILPLRRLHFPSIVCVHKAAVAGMDSGSLNMGWEENVG
jgi:hypothetical protein